VVTGELATTERPSGVIAAVGPEFAQLVVVGLWASTFIVTKATFAQISAPAFIFARFALMILLALSVLWVRRPAGQRGIRRADWGHFLLAGLGGYTFYQLGFTLGLERTSPFSASLLIAMVPLFTVLILAARGERTPLAAWLGIGVAVVGVGLFLADKRATGGTDASVAGDLLALGAAVSFAVYGIVNRPLVARYRPETYTAYALTAGCLPLLAVTAPAALAQDWGRVSVAAWIGVVYMVIFPVYVAYMLWNFAIARRGVATATTFSLLVPIVSGGLSALIFGEAFGPPKLLGAALVLTGLVIVRAPHRPKPAPVRQEEQQ
jgi:drug/metabolite transporter (DMT)-like permease